MNIGNNVAMTVYTSVDLLGGVLNTVGFGSDINIGIPFGKKSSKLIIESGAYVWPDSEWQGYFFGGIVFCFGV